MNIHPIFSTIFCVDNIPNIDNKNLKEYILSLEKQKEKNFTNRNGWQKPLDLNDPMIQKLKFEINDRLQKLHEILGLSDYVIQKIQQFWVNVNKKYSYNVNHAHPDSFLTGVYYVDVPENSGNITLFNPALLNKSNFRLHHNNGSFKQDTNFNMQDITYTPKAGDLIIFNGRIEHNVSMNYTDEDRISITFDTLIFPRDEM